MLAQEKRVARQVRIFGSGKRQQILKEECKADNVQFYHVLKTSTTRWVASRYNCYKSALKTVCQQIELLLTKTMPKKGKKES